MNPQIKEIIDELIEFNKTREPKKYLKNVFNKYGQANVYSLSDWLLLWHKKVFLELAEPDKYDLSEHEVLQKQFREFFEECPDIKKVFALHNDYIGWAKSINEEEQEEIRNYIHENHKIQIRIRRYKG